MASVRPDFKSAEASRPPFDPSLSQSFVKTQAPEPEWKAGQGVNKYADRDEKHHYKIIAPGETKIAAMDMYKLMLGGISPRPVALVSTMSKEGNLNLTVVSWYQMVSHDPPLVMLSFGGDQGRRKDSEINISETGEFTISSASEPYAEALNFSSIDAPHGTSEYALTGLTPVKSVKVRPPRVKEAPFSMECTLDTRKEYTSETGDMTTVLIIGRVKALHIRSDCLNEDGSVNVAQTRPVNRVSGMLYTRATHGFELPRLKWSELKDTPEVSAALRKEVREVDPDFEDAILASYP